MRPLRRTTTIMLMGVLCVAVSSGVYGVVPAQGAASAKTQAERSPSAANAAGVPGLSSIPDPDVLAPAAGPLIGVEPPAAASSPVLAGAAVEAAEPRKPAAATVAQSGTPDEVYAEDRYDTRATAVAPEAVPAAPGAPGRLRVPDPEWARSADRFTTGATAATTAPTSTIEMASALTPEEVIALSPEEVAAAEAALRDGQARMTQAGVQFRLGAIAAAEIELKEAKAELARAEAGATPPEALAEAEAELRDAEASLAEMGVAGIPADQLAAAEAAVRDAEANLAQLRGSGVPPDQLAAAETAVREAEIRLQAAQAGPDPALLAAAQERANLAHQNYDTVTVNTSAAKTAAEQTMVQATDTLRQAQEAYSVSYWQNEQAVAGIDPVTGDEFSDQGLDKDEQQRYYADLLLAAQTRVTEAEASLQQASLVFENARQQEIELVAAAQSELDAARAELAGLTLGPDPAAVSLARSELDGARARLAELTRGPDPAAVSLARSELDGARARLAELEDRSTLSANTMTEAQQRVDAARANLERLQQEGDPEAVAAAQTRVDQAQAQLTIALRAASGGNGWTWPTHGVLTSGFGKRNLAVNQYHNGLDIASAKGTPVGAARGGTVIEAGWCRGYGYCVKIAHGGGLTTEYGHLAGQPPVKAGDTVHAGTIIGLMGTSYDSKHGGYSTGVHLHFTIRYNGQAVDPLAYLP